MPDLTAIEKLAREAKGRAEKATPGEWIAGQRKLKNKPPIDTCPGLSVVCLSAPGQGVFTRHKGGTAPAFDDTFIAAARTDVPALADAVLQLVQQVRDLENGQE